ARPHPAAGQDRGRVPAADLPARAVRPGPGRERDQPPRARRDAGQARRARGRAALPGDRLMRVEQDLVVNAPREDVWAYVTDPGGLLGWLSDQLSAPIVRRNIRNTLLNLNRQIESRQAAQARRAPRKKTAARA